MSAAVRAASLPRAAIPIPTLAARIAAASLTPSPTIAVTRPARSSVWTTSTLCSGDMRANTSLDCTAAVRWSECSASQSLPVMTCPAVTFMPRSRAIAVAVAG